MQHQQKFFAVVVGDSTGRTVKIDKHSAPGMVGLPLVALHLEAVDIVVHIGRRRFEHDHNDVRLQPVIVRRRRTVVQLQHDSPSLTVHPSIFHEGRGADRARHNRRLGPAVDGSEGAPLDVVLVAQDGKQPRVAFFVHQLNASSPEEALQERRLAQILKVVDEVEEVADGVQ